MLTAASRTRCSLVPSDERRAPALHAPAWWEVYTSSGVLEGNGRWSPTHGPALWSSRSVQRRPFTRLWPVAQLCIQASNAVPLVRLLQARVGNKHRQTQQKTRQKLAGTFEGCTGWHAVGFSVIFELSSLKLKPAATGYESLSTMSIPVLKY